MNPEELRTRIELTRDEALVLFEFLSRFSDTKTLSVEHKGEAIALWNLCCLLERELVEPFRPEYQELLKAAQERLKEGIT